MNKLTMFAVQLKRFIHKLSCLSPFNKLLLAVFVVGLLIRIVGTNPGYPPNHPDEPIIYSTADQMVSDFTLNPFFPSYKFQYPGFFIYSVALFDALMVFVNLVIHPITFLTHLGNLHSLVLQAIGIREIHAIFWARYVSAFYGFLAVVLIYLVGKKLFNNYVGLFAALFLALNFRHVISSHLALVDSPNSMTALLSLYLSLRLLENPSKKNYIIAALGVAISFATKLYFVSIAPFLLSHLLISLKKRKLTLILKSLFDPFFLLNLILIGVFFLMLNPFLIFHLGLAIETHRLNDLRYGFGSNTLMVSPIWYLYEIGYGKFLSSLFIVGIFISLLYKKYWLRAIFPLFLIIFPTWALIYYSRGGGYVRNFSSIIPFALLFSALGFFHLVDFFLKKILKFSKEKFLFWAFILGLCISFFQLRNSIILDWSEVRQWNMSCIQSKMIKQFADGDVVAHSSNVPEVYTKNITYVPYGNYYTNKFAFSLSELQEDKIKYLVINYDPIQATFLWWIGLGVGNWGMPISTFDNTFEGLAIKELSRYQSDSCIKPWQSIDNNFSLIKIPQNKTYTNISSMVIIDKQFRIPTGSIPLSPQRTTVSSFIPVVSGKKYLVRGLISADAEIPKKEKDGFLRIDFYKDKNQANNRGITTAISSRFYGSSWQEKEVSQVAPDRAKFMVVSFQSEDYKVNLYLKDVVIYEVKDDSDAQEIKAVNTKEVEDLILYPTSVL